MAPKKPNAEFYIGDSKHLTIQNTAVVRMKDQLKLMTDAGKSIVLDVDIKANFDTIPQEYQQIFCQMMMVRYGGIVNIWDNTQPFAKPEVKKKRWYQIWK